ncbi:MAG: GNAT family N-acetyltransferase [Chloroflexi bacterium]|nr:MAG: GNAT family N-acetyltransferase [Chloroflexota bacterium]
MLSTSVVQPVENTDHIRPVRLRTDLAALADLIEVCFADRMDAEGRAAVNEMRSLSQMGPLMSMVIGMGSAVLSNSKGFVWVEDGKIVGNVSLYPANNWPHDLGAAWIVANVATHPDYRRRGIARKLMQASMNLIQQSRVRYAVLQVDEDNIGAQRLYESLGFITEREWITWRRNTLSNRPEHPPKWEDVHITRRRRSEWRSEMRLAQQVRPIERGGLGWLQPLHPDFFRLPWNRVLTNLLNFRSTERLVIHHPETGEIAASLWIHTAFASRLRLQLMTLPEYQGLFDDALIHTAIRRYGHRAMVIEHPADEAATIDVLRSYSFRRSRSLINMRWDVPRQT